MPQPTSEPSQVVLTGTRSVTVPPPIRWTGVVAVGGTWSRCRTGGSYIAALANDQQLTLADVQVAEARPRDPAQGGVVMAIRVPGADPQAVVDATFSSSNALQLRTLGGKSVYDVAGTGLNVVVYVKDDGQIASAGRS